MAGGISLTPVLSNVSPDVAAFAGSGATSGAADFGSVLSSMLSGSVGLDDGNPLAVLPDETGSSEAAQQEAAAAPIVQTPAEMLAQLLMAASAPTPVAASIQHQDAVGEERSFGLSPHAGRSEMMRQKLAGIAAVPLSAQSGREAEVVDVIDNGVFGDVLVEQLAVGGKMAAEFAVDWKDLPQERHELQDAGSQQGPVGATAMPVDAKEIKPAAKPVEMLATPVGKQGWAEELGQKVVFFARDQQQFAELQLNPPNLGPLEIRLSLQSDQASLMFVSAHASVRDVIQAALPKLSSMLAESGISMGSAMVGDHSMFGQHQPSPQQENNRRHGSSRFEPLADVSMERFELVPGRGQGWAVSMFV